MHLAERASTHPPVMLSRHYRCLPQIIQWCNDVVYDPPMVPHREPTSGGPFQPISHIAVNGVAERPTGGSQINQGEAVAIVSWLCRNRSLIENAYGPLGRAVAIVTPYRAHAKLLEEQLRQTFLGDERALFGLVVGTVHRLQGAEAPIVLFSVCATNPGSTAFLDEKPNLLNVAVSRAKDSFIGVAHPGMLARRDEKPLGRLMEWLSPHPLIDVIR